MKINILIIFTIFLFSCTNKPINNEYDLFLNDYIKNKSYHYIINNNDLIPKNKYNGIIDEVENNNKDYYLRINNNYNSYLEKISYPTSKKINLNNEIPTIYYPYKNNIIFSPNYLKNNFIKKTNYTNLDDDKTYYLNGYFVDHIRIENNLIYLFVQNQINKEQKILIFDLSLKLKNTIKLEEKININSSMTIDEKNIYYISNNNYLIKIDKNKKQNKLLKLDEKYANKLIIKDEYLFINHYDIFDQKHNNIITKINLENLKIEKKKFDYNIVDFIIKKNRIILLNNKKIFFYDKNFNFIKTIKIDNNLTAEFIQ